MGRRGVRKSSAARPRFPRGPLVPPARPSGRAAPSFDLAAALAQHGPAIRRWRDLGQRAPKGYLEEHGFTPRQWRTLCDAALAEGQDRPGLSSGGGRNAADAQRPQVSPAGGATGRNAPRTAPERGQRPEERGQPERGDYPQRGPRTHLVIPDAHAEPDEDPARFTWLGRMIADLRPDVVVCLGDWFDMPSLSSYDKGRRAFEGRRYVRDIEAGNEALRLLHAELPGSYRPEFVVTLGNHCDRINRAANDAAEFEGLISTDDLDFARRGWRVVPYMESTAIDGVHYSHHVPSGVMNRPIGGEHAANALIRKRLVSTTVGHSHTMDFAIRTDGAGRKVHGLVAGCYFEAHHGYAGQANALYWRGIVVCRDVVEGTYDPEFFSIGRIRRRWGP